MTLAQVSRLTMRRALGAPRPLQSVPRRGLATHEPQVSWSEYRSGQKTFAEWVDANRHIVAGSMFAFYVSLAAWSLRPGKGKKKKAAAAEAAEKEAAAAAAPAK